MINQDFNIMFNIQGALGFQPPASPKASPNPEREGIVATQVPMAAATGYDGPNDEQLHAYADLSYAHQPFYGSNLVEVFAVRVPDAAASSRGNRLPPCGIVEAGGTYCSQSMVFARICHADQVTPQPCDSQVQILTSYPLYQSTPFQFCIIFV